MKNKEPTSSRLIETYSIGSLPGVKKPNCEADQNYIYCIVKE
jgi:hypothetical protein